MVPKRNSFLARVAGAQGNYLEMHAKPVTLPALSFLDPLNRLPFEWEAARAAKAKPKLIPGRNGQPMPRLVSARIAEERERALAAAKDAERRQGFKSPGDRRGGKRTRKVAA